MKAWIIVLLGLCALSAQAYENRCYERFNGYVQAKCPGKQLPSDRLRNFHSSSHQIVCTGNSDSYVRMPQKYDFTDWNDLRLAGKNQKAFDLRRALPEITWSGRIPYQTVEVWEWEECSLGTSAAECGMKEVCTTVPVQRCSGSGDDRECRTTYEKQCHWEAKTCWYDHTRYEAMHCTNEAMNFTAKYQKPGPEWNIGSHEYAEFLPNKYDLMPGEVEVVQVYNNGNRSSVMTPYVAIGDAWNKYNLNDITGTGVNAQCIPNKQYEISLRIHTLERDTTKASPNAFRLPVDFEGKPMEAISNWFGNTKIKKGQPAAIMLDDTSAAMVGSLSEHSKQNAYRVKAKAEVGKMVNQDALSNEQARNDGFYKNTILKINLIKKNRYWFNRHLGWSVYSNDVKSVTTSSNTYSKDEDIMLSEKWEVDLLTTNTRTDMTGKRSGIYKNDLFALQADRVYALQVAMYQKGVPFYKQDCDNDPNAPFYCNYPLVGRRESSYFSKPLEIRFETHKDWDNGSFSNFMYNGGIGPENLIRWLFEPLVAEPTTGENQ